MKNLGKKANTQIHSLGVKSKSLAHTLGNKNTDIPNQIANLISPNKVGLTITGIGVSNLIPNSSNSSSLQYLPTGMKSKLEKRKK